VAGGVLAEVEEVAAVVEVALAPREVPSEGGTWTGLAHYELLSVHTD
jgi:hypothetical protein